MPLDRGLLPLKRETGRGVKPHFALRFRAEGEVHTFGVDTSRCDVCDRFLVSHAHSDHSGKSAMLSERSLASVGTAEALEILEEREFEGETFEVGDRLDLGVKVETHGTGHAVGSTAFSWENERGVRILVTGDVKDYSELPSCDLLLCEATYGDPLDPGHVFEDEVSRFVRIVESTGPRLFLGAYTYGKSQRAAELLREKGYRGAIGMEEKARELTEALTDAGPFCDAGEAEVNIVSPWRMDRYEGEKYVLTGMDRYLSTINISDHLDRRGLLEMVEHCDPELVLPYHPDDRGPCGRFARYVEEELSVPAEPLHDSSETMVL